MPTFAEETKQKTMLRVSELIDRNNSFVADCPDWFKINLKRSLLTPSARHNLNHPREATPDALKAWELYNAEQVDSTSNSSSNKQQ